MEHNKDLPAAQVPYCPLLCCHSQVNDDYLEFLMELDKKLKFVHENEEAKMSQVGRQWSAPLTCCTYF